MRKITNKKLLNQATHIESYIPNVIIIIEYNLISNYNINGTKNTARFNEKSTC